MEGTTPHEVLAGFQGKVKMLERFVQENELEAVKGEIGRKLTSKDIHQAASAVSSETTKCNQLSPRDSQNSFSWLFWFS